MLDSCSGEQFHTVFNSPEKNSQLNLCGINLRKDSKPQVLHVYHILYWKWISKLNTNVTSVSGLYTGRIWHNKDRENKLKENWLWIVHSKTLNGVKAKRSNKILVLKRFQL